MDTFNKQPSEALDYDFDFSDFLTACGDTLSSSVVTADAGVVVQSKVDNAAAGTVKVFLSGGVTGTTYKVTCVMTTVAGRIKEAEFKLKVKEI